jgi:hypothetical protein
MLVIQVILAILVVSACQVAGLLKDILIELRKGNR